jgi:hypothetical protein
MSFTKTYERYIENVANSNGFGYDLKTLARSEAILSFLYKYWWRVDLTGLQHLPIEGPALIVGNSGSIWHWPGLMLLYAMMKDKTSPRRLNIVCDLDFIEDERLYSLLVELGFVPWSADNLKDLFDSGEIVAVFPEGMPGLFKSFSERYRLRNFDWTRIFPAIEKHIPIYPLVTLGCDESFPQITNIEAVARYLSLPAFPITPFMPLLPFPFSLASFPIRWKMRLMKAITYKGKGTRHELEESAKKEAFFLEGEIQAELNRLLRSRIKSI